VTISALWLRNSTRGWCRMARLILVGYSLWGTTYPMPDISAAYRPRKPQDSQYCRCVEEHFEEFGHVYDERFAIKYGFFSGFF
jgi:hypothetical protein